MLQCDGGLNARRYRQKNGTRTNAVLRRRRQQASPWRRRRLGADEALNPLYSKPAEIGPSDPHGFLRVSADVTCMPRILLTSVSRR
jgi:hypothetical protein